MEKQVKTKRCRGLRGWIFTIALCAALALVLLIGYNGFNWGSPPSSLQDTVNTEPTPINIGTDSGANDEPSSSQEVLYFPRSDGGDERIQIPLRTALAQLSVDSVDGSHNTLVPPVPEMTFPLEKEMEGQIEATLVYRPDIGGGYLLLVPAGWQAAAVVGANGSYGVTFQDPNNPEQNLHYSDNAWGCVGCAISGIGTYFPGKEEWADEMGFTIYEPLDFKEQHTLGNEGAEARTVRYNLPAGSNGYQVDGSAYYDKVARSYLFRNMEIKISVESPQRELVETIMDFFITNNGPLFIPDSNDEETK